MPSITELVCDLGLAGELVGRTGFCIHPREAVRRVPKVGGTKSVNLAKVRSLDPTHVILNVDENTKQTADALAGFVPNLIVTHPLGPEDNLTLYRQIGAAFGRQKEAEALCASFQSSLDAVRSDAFRRTSVLYLIWKKPWMTVSPDTYISRTLALVGLQTLPSQSDSRYPKVRLDEAWMKGVDLVLVSTEPYRFTPEHLEEIGAATGKPALLIDGEMTSWYGSRAIAGLRYLAEFSRRLSGS